MKNAFYFMLKTLFVFEIIKLLSWVFGYVEKRFDKKAKVNFKIHNVNQTIKFDQLIEGNMRNIFLEKSYTKCNGEASPRLFYEKSKLSISLDQQSKML